MKSSIIIQEFSYLHDPLSISSFLACICSFAQHARDVPVSIVYMKETTQSRGKSKCFFNVLKGFGFFHHR